MPNSTCKFSKNYKISAQQLTVGSALAEDPSSFLTSELFTHNHLYFQLYKDQMPLVSGGTYICTDMETFADTYT